MNPPIQDGKQRNSVLPPIRISHHERECIKDRAQKAGLSLSEYVRTMALKGKIVIKQSKTDTNLVRSLGKLGVNLNQIAAKLHSTGRVDYRLSGLIRKLETLIDLLLKQKD